MPKIWGIMKKNKNVEVEWIDSITTHGWRDYEPVDMNCRIVGILIDNNKENIVIAQNESVLGYGDYMTIPKVAVKRVRKL